MTTPARPAPVSDSDRIVLVLLAMLALAGGLPVLAWTTAERWLVEQQILLPATSAPVLLLPGGQTGLDWPRLLITTGALLGLLGAVLVAVRRRRNRDEEGLR